METKEVEVKREACEEEGAGDGAVGEDSDSSIEVIRCIQSPGHPKSE